MQHDSLRSSAVHRGTSGLCIRGSGIDASRCICGCAGVGMLCWGLLANVRPLVDLYEYLLKSSTDLAREAPPQRKSRILGVRLHHRLLK